MSLTAPSILNSGSDPELKLFEDRLRQMVEYRKNPNGVDIEKLWQWAEADTSLLGYEEGRKSNSTQGLSFDDPANRTGSARVGEDWHSDNSSAKTFSKCQTALAMLFDRNPESWAESKRKKFQGFASLASAFLDDSHDKERFKSKLKSFVVNQMTYGIAFGRTFAKKNCRTTFSPTPDGKETENKVEHYSEKFEVLSPWNVWLDENSRHDDLDSTNDWAYRKVYSDTEVLDEFGDSQEVKDAIAKSKGNVSRTGQDQINAADPERTDLNELFFYENKSKDRVMVSCNGDCIYKGRLARHKELSLLYAIWNHRLGYEGIYGVGLPEILRQNKLLFDKIRNMSIDQLALAIYTTFFHDPTLQTDDGDLELSPGRGYKSMNPKDIQFLKVPPPDAEGVKREDKLSEDMDEDTGITRAMSGSMNIDARMPASMILMAKEASLQKLKTPLDALLEMMEREAQLRWSLIQDINRSQSEVLTLTEPDKIQEYMDEYAEASELWNYDKANKVLSATKTKPFMAGVKKVDDKTYKRSEERNQFYVTPTLLDFDGIFKFKAESVLVYNKELIKQMKMDLANMLIPLLSQDPAFVKKPAEQMCRIQGESPEDWLPDAWYQQTPQQAQVPIESETVVPRSETEPGVGSAVDSFMRRLVPRKTGPQ